MVYYKFKTISNRYVPNKGRYLRRGKRSFAGSVLFPLLNLSRRSLRRRRNSPLFSKPFTGIYLFAPQKDKCHSNFEKILNAQVYLSFLSTYPHWEQNHFFSPFHAFTEIVRSSLSCSSLETFEKKFRPVAFSTASTVTAKVANGSSLLAASVKRCRLFLCRKGGVSRLFFPRSARCLGACCLPPCCPVFATFPTPFLQIVYDRSA